MIRLKNDCQTLWVLGSFKSVQITLMQFKFDDKLSNNFRDARVVVD